MKKNATLVLSAAVAALISAAPISSYASHSTFDSIAPPIGMTTSAGKMLSMKMTSPTGHNTDAFFLKKTTAFAVGEKLGMAFFDKAKTAAAKSGYTSDFKAEGDYLALGKMVIMDKHKFRTSSTPDLGGALAESHASGLGLSYTIA